MPHELLTEEGEVLLFDSKDDLIDYVISRMIEKSRLTPIGRDESGDIVLQSKDN